MGKFARPLLVEDCEIPTNCTLKLGCAFKLVITFEFRMGTCSDNDHREDVSHFTQTIKD